MTELAALHATVRGRVQGVFFRDFVSRHARSLHLTGWVRNLPSGREVAVWAEGDRPALERLLEHLRIGPPGGRVDGVEMEWPTPTGSYRGFTVRY